VSPRAVSLCARSSVRASIFPALQESGLKARGVSKVARDADYSAERALIEAAQREPHRFAELYEANFERVYAYVVRRVRDRDDAQDLTADVFHLALKSLPRFEWRGVPFAAWLFRIAANEIADRSKSIAKRRAHERVLPFEENDAGASDASGFEEAERRGRLFKLVERLPRDQSRVIVMRFTEQKSIREIATALDRSEGSIKQLQFRAMQNLRVRMGDSNG
jgi:RNA polymerase sigma-70 factor, ECF subfamily